jgi:predicted nucleic acid-binding protein
MATKSDEAYVDTSALIAFVDRSDSFHHLFRRAFADRPPLVTTPLVVAEGHGWFVRRFDSYRGLEFMAMIENMRPLKIVRTGQSEIVDAAAVLRRFSDQKLTLVDAAGLSLMAERRIRSCWSTDFHLGLTGVPLLIHQR